jgi:sugar phosphate isomerase/epimerase
MRGLALCARTVPQTSFVDRVALAARYGFTHVSLMGNDALTILDGTLPPASARALLDAHGIAISELDAVLGWLPSDVPLPPEMRSPVGEAEFCTIADQLGATMVNVVDVVAGPTPPLDECAAAFAAVCDRAAAHGLRAGIEFVPSSPPR